MSKSIPSIAISSLVPFLLLILISFGVVGGCSSNGGGGGGGGDAELFTLGDHRDDPLDHIGGHVPHAPHTGEPGHILLDGMDIENLTDEEIELIREAYDEGFIIIAYDVSRKDIAMLYRDIIDHPFRHADLDNLEQIPVGARHGIFTIEHHNGLDWTSTAQFEMSGHKLIPENIDEEVILFDEAEYSPHGAFIRLWLDEHELRRLEVIEEGLVDMSAEELLDELDLRDEFDEELAAVTRDSEEGTLLDLANANIHTTTNLLSFHETTNKDAFQMTSKAWIVTGDTPTGQFSFLMVAQDFNLSTSNGYVSDDGKNKYWYLAEFSVKNTYSVNGVKLNNNQAQLLQESPETNQATSLSETTSVDVSIGGTIGADATGGNASVSGGITWSSSTTVSKADVSINNKSISDGSLLNDATWQFLPRAAEKNDKKCYKNAELQNLADLSHNTFQPATAFVVRIDDQYVGQTLNLDSIFTIQTRQTYIDCNAFNCACKAVQHNGLSPWRPTHTHSIHIPHPPEGPAGEDTCSDGVDNDQDGNTDSADNEC